MKSLGTAAVLAASLCFSTGGLLMKIVPWNPLAINGVRNVIAAVVIGLYILATHHKIKFNFTVLVGAVSMAGVTTLFAIANKLTTAGNTIILQYTAPIWIVILMFLIFGEKPDRTALISILIVLVGILCFFFEALSTGKWIGDLCALMSGIFYAGVFMLNSFEKGDALSSVFFGQIACGVFLSPLVV
ncbi:MAG: DMT family transporter, partial [Lachnospiraceae bacterium]|nr:DMT family transporter [Lachnospiraceae bacterium]